MPSFSKTSVERLETCCNEIQTVCHQLIKVFDFTVAEGYRNEERQNYYYKTGASKLRYPKSKHNGSPSLAVDIAPWPLDWNSEHGLRRFDVMAGYFLGIAAANELKFRWGGDWDGDNTYSDQDFHDRPHFEFVGHWADIVI